MKPPKRIGSSDKANVIQLTLSAAHLVLLQSLLQRFVIFFQLSH